MNNKNYFLMYKHLENQIIQVSIIPSTFNIKIESEMYKNPRVLLLDENDTTLISCFVNVEEKYQSLYKDEKEYIVKALFNIIMVSLKSHLDMCRQGDMEFAEPFDFNYESELWSQSLSRECESYLRSKL